MVRMLVEPVLGTSTKMHLYLWQITSSGSLVYPVNCDWHASMRDENGSAGTRTRNQRLKRAISYDRYLTQLPISCQWNQHEQTKAANRIKKANVAVHSIFRARKFMDGGCQN